MRQQDYETILRCIQYGAPALAPELIQSFNGTVEKENQFIEMQRAKAEEARKREFDQQAKSAIERLEGGIIDNSEPVSKVNVKPKVVKEK